MAGLRRINSGRSWHNDKESDYALQETTMKFILEQKDYLLMHKKGNKLLEKIKSMKRQLLSNKFLTGKQIKEIERIYEITIVNFGNKYEKEKGLISKDGSIREVKNQKDQWGNVNLKV